ncbi:MAG: pyridoxine 5'-phosphate synthase [Phycisphaerales bacterium]|jgi:pyridoxine 5-phosphate synthase|nr:pyridoxine 5'-phosphate synthase [Phycisphaerales bacterium]
MAILSVNIDHVATVREARKTYEPDPVEAAREAELGGARGITCHLREDRRHVQDADVDRLAEVVGVPLNFEMAATSEMVEIALRLRPSSAMLVPEGRDEVTTEGGLDVAARKDGLTGIVARFTDAGVPASAFIDAEATQIEAAAACGFAVCEVHTGPWAHSCYEHGVDSAQAQAELDRVASAGRLIAQAGMRFNAGHALGYENIQPIARLDDLCELHIGHAIISRAMFTGMQTAVRDMVGLIESAIP